MCKRVCLVTFITQSVPRVNDVGSTITVWLVSVKMLALMVNLERETRHRLGPGKSTDSSKPTSCRQRDRIQLYRKYQKEVGG